MNRFGNGENTAGFRTVVSIVLFSVVIVLFILGISAISNSSAMNSRTILEQAITRDIAHCYAVEGSYPVSVEYMSEHYGLIYDTERFIINYEYIGDNIIPEFRVIER